LYRAGLSPPLSPEDDCFPQADILGSKQAAPYRLSQGLNCKAGSNVNMSDDFIPYGRQSINQQDIDAVAEVLRSDFLTQGPKVPAFEKAIADYTGATYAVAVNSATSALHLACLALGLKPGGLLWTTPITFVASANCGRYCGADIDFVDIDSDTYNLSNKALERKLVQAKAAGRLPDIVVAVDFTGQPCDWAELTRLKAAYGFALIEDASHALGATWQGQKVGSVKGADITILSFHPVKIIATGEGGMALTENDQLAGRMQLFRTHGIVREVADLVDQTQGAWYHEQHCLGFNYRMTDLQAALGLSQLDRLDAFLARRRELAARYDKLLAGLPVILPHQAAGANSSWHLYVIQLKNAGWRRQVFDAMRAAGIGVQVHYIPVHTQPDYKALGFKPGDFPVAEAYYSSALTLPLFPGLTNDQQDRVVRTLTTILQDLA
jgi:UDP-4-amino-4,6-dideoxy-N-acetyl-beta-L-altrosamine transaminase